MSDGRDPASAVREQVTDYSGYDFRGQWAGRSRVTQVESALLARGLEEADPTRILEAASGFGRLTAPLLERSREVVVTDLDVGGLQVERASSAGRRPVLRVAANLYHLPFASGSFSFATLVRVHHHLPDARPVLREIARVLRPGGALMISYNPRPSLGTLWIDLRRGLRPVPGRPFVSATFARSDPVALPPDPFPVYVGTRRRFSEEIRAAGFTVVHEWATGLEEFPVLRDLPVGSLMGLATAWGSAGGLPMRWALLRTVGDGARALPDLGSILACPQCGESWPIPSSGGPKCPRCGLRRDLALDPLDLRYLPEGAERYRSGTTA